jgi:hypothetical protein
MSRDSDSPLISREKEAVTEWLASNKSFHIMRDHPVHCFFGFIMSGNLLIMQTVKSTTDCLIYRLLGSESQPGLFLDRPSG